LGIIGLISYTTQLKRKEIAVRKVLGSSFTNIVTILSQRFVLLLILANSLAMPATYYLTGFWLENFEYRIEPGPGPFIVAFFVSILFTAVSILYHTVQAALANPVDALKYE
jgi:putative ABC transport system permease protein